MDQDQEQESLDILMDDDQVDEVEETSSQEADLDECHHVEVIEEEVVLEDNIDYEIGL